MEWKEINKLLKPTRNMERILTQAFHREKIIFIRGWKALKISSHSIMIISRKLFNPCNISHSIFFYLLQKFYFITTHEKTIKYPFFIKLWKVILREKFYASCIKNKRKSFFFLNMFFIPRSTIFFPCDITKSSPEFYGNFF